METPTVSQTIGLIKAGCFDALEGISRKAIVRRYVERVAAEQNPIKDALTATHIKKAIASKMPLPGYKEEIFMMNFKRWIDDNQVDPSDKKRYILSDRDAVSFFENKIMYALNPQKDEYAYTPKGIAVKKSALERVYAKAVQRLKDYFSSEEGRKAYAAHMQALCAAQLMADECSGTPARWEMEQMCFYHAGHELARVSEAAYGISDFAKLPETPIKTSYTDASGQRKESVQTTALAGTIVNVENGRKMVWLLTTHGVVTVKFYAESFNKYKNPISKVDPKTGKKTVIDRAWLKRGEKILVYGYRRDDAFIARMSRAGSRSRLLCRIEGVDSSGDLILTYTRGEENR